MGKREEAINYLEELIKAYPGQRADFYIPRVCAEVGVSSKKVSEYLRLLHESGKIQLINDKFYPAGAKAEDLNYHEKTLLAWLDKKAKDVTRETEKKQDEDTYLVVYDIKNEMKSVSRRTIYRKLRKAVQEIIKNGGHVERIQMSVWKVRGRHNALLLASCIPETHSRIRVFKIVEEEK